MALSDTPAVLLALLEDEALPDAIEAQKTQIFGELLALFAPDYTEPPYTIKALGHLAGLLSRWGDVTIHEMQRLHRLARHEINDLEKFHVCIVCTSPHERKKFKRPITDADLAVCPVQKAKTRYGVVL